MRFAAKHARLVGADLLDQEREDQASGLVAVQHCAYDQVAQSSDMRFEALTDGPFDGGLKQRGVVVLDVGAQRFRQKNLNCG